MSYLNDAAWNSVFSNPNLDCNGEPCGVAKGQNNAADNKTSFNITGPLVEAFKVDTTGGDIKTIGKPAIDRATDVGVFIWENTKNKWVMNFVSGGTQRTVDFDVTSQAPLTNVAPLSIESSDVFTQSTKQPESEIECDTTMDGRCQIHSFRINPVLVYQPKTLMCAFFIGPNRVEMPSSFDLSTLEACDTQNITTIGSPTIDRTKDIGIFIWENTTNKWVMNVVSGDKNRVVEIDVSSQQSLSNVAPLSIEPSDVVTQSAKSLDMRLNVTPPWMDGIKFTVQDQSSTCVSTTNSNVPIYIGPSRINVNKNINLNTLKSC